MGCDIHIFAEKKEEGQWKKVGEVFKSCFSDSLTDKPFDGRNYDLFAILADVRNGRGFAGCKTGEGFNPIAEPKGIPQDSCRQIKQKADDWAGDGHSHSYFTVEELDAYDWNQTVRKWGVVAYHEYLRVRDARECPNDWCGTISGPNIITLNEDQLEYLPEGKDIYVNYTWDSLYSERVGFFLDTALPKLRSLGKPDEVRIVFWFDN